MSADAYTLDFGELRMGDVGLVGGKNASLGEMFNAFGPHGVGVPDGFATTAPAYRRFLEEDDLEDRLRTIFDGLDVGDVAELAERGRRARQAVLKTPVRAELNAAFVAAYRSLCDRTGREVDVAVRSSATAGAPCRELESGALRPCTYRSVRRRFSTIASNNMKSGAVIAHGNPRNSSL